MENEIKVNEYVRTKYGGIGKVTETYPRLRWRKKKASGVWEYNLIKNHSSNLIDLIQCGDYVNGKEVKHIADFEGINKLIKKLIFIDKKHLIPGETAENEDIERVVTKEQFESISYKVKE